MARRTATGPNGEKLVLENGQWVPLESSPAAAAPATKLSPAAQDQITRDAMKTAAGELVANMIGLPHAAGELLALGAAGIRTGAGAALAAAKGEPMNLGDRFQRAREYEEGNSYAGLLMKAPEPSGEDVLRAVGVEPPTNPISQSAGRAVADISTLMTMRPSARIKAILKSRGRPVEGAVDPETRSVLNRAAATLRPLLGGGKKAVEAGFEGAVVGALGEGDPATTAAWSAGIQAGGSAALAAKSAIMRHPFKSFGTLWLGHEMFKALAPGPQNALESKDTTVQEMVGAYGLGIAASLAGAGRGTDAQRVVNALSQASRGGIASVVTQLQEASAKGNREYERVIGKIAEDPDYFGQEIRVRLERAARSEKPNELTREIDRLMKSTRFRRQYDAIE